MVARDAVTQHAVPAAAAPSRVSIKACHAGTRAVSEEIQRWPHRAAIAMQGLDEGGCA
jgi:hypothetical protein